MNTSITRTTLLVLSLAISRCSMSAGLPLTGHPNASGDNFGVSVAIDSSHILIGASQTDANGFDSGSAYVFNAIDGSYERELLASDGLQLDRFGESVALAGTKAVVGAFLEDSQGDRAGAAYVFDIQTGAQLHKLVAQDAAPVDFFGTVAATPGLALVGAPSKDDVGVDSGSAYLFDLSTGQQIRKLLAPDGVAGDRFGVSLAVDQRFTVIGANQVDRAGGHHGAAYVFDTATGAFLRRLEPTDIASLDGFGQAISLEGDRVLVGTRLSNTAYLFDITTGQQLQKFVPPIPSVFPNFGNAVGLSGPTAVIGAAIPSDAIGGGRVAYVYNVDSGQAIGVLRSPTQPQLFGLSVAVSGTHAVVGDAWQQPGGAAYRFSVPEPMLLAYVFGPLLWTFDFRRR